MWESLLVDGGPWGLVGFFLLALSRDWLITHRSHMREIGYLDRIIQSLEAANEAERRSTAEYRQQVTILLGRAKDSPRGGHGDGGGSVV